MSMQPIYIVVSFKGPFVQSKSYDTLSEAEAVRAKEGGEVLSDYPSVLGYTTSVKMSDIVVLYENVSGRKVKAFKSKEEAAKRIWRFINPGMTSVETAPSKLKEEISMPTKKKPAHKKRIESKKRPVAKGQTAKKTQPKKGQATKKPVGRRVGVGAMVQRMLLAGKKREAIVDAIRKDFPDSTAGGNEISWYASKLRRDGLLKK